MTGATKEALANRLRMTTDALMCAASSELREAAKYSTSQTGWAEWANEARTSYELLGHADSFWELAGCFHMLPLVEETRPAVAVQP